MARTCKVLFVPVILLQAVFFYFVSQHRLIDGDEGYYALASRLVLQHKTPYLDFFYPQAPLLPYVYALWLKVCGVSWFSARAFSALLTVFVGGLLYAHVCRETKKWIAGVAAGILFATSSLVFCWFPTVKTFSLSALFLFAAYVVLARIGPASSGWPLAAAGVLFGLSVDTRSYFIALAPVFLFWIFRRGGERRVLWLVWFAVGCLVGLLPSAILFLASPDRFFFNNLGFHAVRASQGGLLGTWRNKARVIKVLFIGTHTGGQFSILAISSAVLMYILYRRRLRLDSALLAWVLAFVLGVVCLLPNPSALQYFSAIMPFLIAAVVCWSSEFFQHLQSQRALRFASASAIVLGVGFIGFGVLSFEEYLFTGPEVPGLENAADAPNWTLPQVSAVSAAIDQLVLPGEEVATFWPGYIFASWADPVPGFENNFGMIAAQELSPERRQKYHVVYSSEISRMFASHRPRVAVVGNQGPWNGGPDYVDTAAALRGYGYNLVRKVGATSIYECCGGSP
jgi:4-amino-4-deoxy-L-arabinose transferase-like glycosyltransferase